MNLRNKRVVFLHVHPALPKLGSLEAECWSIPSHQGQPSSGPSGWSPKGMALSQLQNTKGIQKMNVYYLSLSVALYSFECKGDTM